jgi:hypothetical protein
MEHDTKKSKAIIKILEKHSIKYEYEEENTVNFGFHWSLVFCLYEDMVSFDKIYGEIKPYELSAQISTEFDKDDMDKAEWYKIFALPSRYPLPDDDFGYIKLTFDLNNWCPYCNVGKIQNNPYRLKQPKQKSAQFWGLFWEEALFCGEAIKNIFEKENIQGIHFIQPVNKKNIPFEGYYQIMIETTLDKGFYPDNTEVVFCNEKNYHKKDYELETEHCGRIKYEHIHRGGYTFEKNIFSSKFDFYLSNEWFGSGGEAYRLSIISKKVYEIIIKHKLKGLNIEPILYK